MRGAARVRHRNGADRVSGVVERGMAGPVGRSVRRSGWSWSGQWRSEAGAVREREPDG